MPTHIIGTYQAQASPTFTLRSYTRDPMAANYVPFDQPTLITAPIHLIRSHRANNFTAAGFTGAVLVMEDNRTAHLAVDSMTNAHLLHDRLANETNNSNAIGDEYILDGCFGYSTDDVILLLNNSVGYILAQIKVKIAGTMGSGRTVSIMNSKYYLIPSTFANIVALPPDYIHSLYQHQIIYNRYNNKVYIMFTNTMVSF